MSNGSTFWSKFGKCCRFIVYVTIAIIVLDGTYRLAYKFIDHAFPLRKTHKHSLQQPTEQSAVVCYPDAYKDTYDLFDKHFTIILVVGGFVVTIFGLVIPFGTYLLQRQSLKDERRGMKKDYKTMRCDLDDVKNYIEDSEKKSIALMEKIEQTDKELSETGQRLLLQQAMTYRNMAVLYSTLNKKMETWIGILFCLNSLSQHIENDTKHDVTKFMETYKEFRDYFNSEIPKEGAILEGDAKRVSENLTEIISNKYLSEDIRSELKTLLEKLQDLIQKQAQVTKV